MDYEAPEKYNFPPVSSRATHEDRSEHQHATSSRLSRLSTWRNPLACARNRKLAFASHAERHGYSSGRSGRGVCYEYTNSPLGITRLGKNSGGCHETSSDSEGSPCGRETRESCVSQPRQLVSKLTVHVVKWWLNQWRSCSVMPSVHREAIVAGFAWMHSEIVLVLI